MFPSVVSQLENDHEATNYSHHEGYCNSHVYNCFYQFGIGVLVVVNQHIERSDLLVVLELLELLELRYIIVRQSETET